jgi:hypothetical protein
MTEWMGALGKSIDLAQSITKGKGPTKVGFSLPITTIYTHLKFIYIYIPNGKCEIIIVYFALNVYNDL